MVFVLLVSVLFDDPLPSIYWWAVSVGGDDLKWRQLGIRPSYNACWDKTPHSTAKTNDKSTFLRKNGL